MRTPIHTLAALALLLASTLPAPSGAADLDPATARTVEGTVVELNVADPGQGPSTLLVQTGADRLDIRLGPQRYLAERAFTLEPGDRVKLAVFDCPHCGALVAGSLENLSTGTTLTLRGDDGLPLWRGAGKGCRRGRGMGAGRGPGAGRGQGRGPRDGTGPRCPRG